jgi:hypothetical protein
MSRALPLLCLVLAAAVLPAEQALAAHPPLPGREVSLLPTEVRDTFFAYVLGIIKSGIDIDIDNIEMREVLSEFKSTLSVPFDLIARVTQSADPKTGQRRIGLEFQRNVSIPIPFALLFYHPGSIVSDQDLSFDVRRTTYTDPASPAVPAPVFDLSLSQGAVLVDIDAWLEVLLRAYLEDTWIRHLVFFTWRGDWIGLLQGTGRRTGREMRAYFNFTRNTIVFPTPAGLDRAARGFLPPQPRPAG